MFTSSPDTNTRTLVQTSCKFMWLYPTHNGHVQIRCYARFVIQHLREGNDWQSVLWAAGFSIKLEGNGGLNYVVGRWYSHNHFYSESIFCKYKSVPSPIAFDLQFVRYSTQLDLKLLIFTPTLKEQWVLKREHNFADDVSWIFFNNQSLAWAWRGHWVDYSQGGNLWPCYVNFTF